MLCYVYLTTLFLVFALFEQKFLLKRQQQKILKYWEKNM